MKVYCIITTTYKTQSIAEIRQTFQQKLLYFSKNYDKIKEKFKEFVDKTSDFMSQHTTGLIGKHYSEDCQNTTPDSSCRNACFLISKDYTTIINISDIDITEINNELQIGDYVEITPEATSSFAETNGFSTRDLPTLFRVIGISTDGAKVKVMVLCGSKAVANTISSMANQYTLPKNFVRRITKL